jgi:hypothetical protein
MNKTATEGYKLSREPGQQYWERRGIMNKATDRFINLKGEKEDLYVDIHFQT